jgi:hypothetical protein
MTAEARPLAELTQEAIRVLYRELGVVDTVRFLRQFSLGFGSYTEERNALFANKTVSGIAREIRRGRKA